jgi:HTH-type transcriptional regulator, sugar sensing transcriptional regulator
MDLEKSLKRTLLALGLSTKEINFFLNNFKLGPSSVNEVAKAAKLERSTAYLICEELLEKGLLEQDYKEYGKKIFTTEPKKLIAMLASKQRVLRRQELELEESLPDLQAIYSVSEIRPKVKVFEGNSGLLSVWKDILSTKGEILVWTNQETDRLVFGPTKHINFIEERVKKAIKARVLAVNNQEGRSLQKLDSQNLRETKLLKPGVNFTAETYIYDNKIAILDYKKDIIGVVIESEPITSSQKAIFEMNWNF